MNTPKAGYIPAATLCLALTPFAGAAQAQSADPATSRLQVTQIADGLEEPWALDFLPDGRFLVTERDGMLFLYSADGSARNAVSGLPEIVTPGQGGLLDVMVTRDFANTSRIWLSYAAPASGGAGTSAGFGTLSADGIALQGFRQVIDPVGRGGGRHFGSRLVEAADGTVFVTTGERGNPPLAQETGGPEGKVLAFDAGGTPKTASEFSGQSGVWPGLYSYGHRNIQGAALDATGRLVTVEHGAQGGTR